MPGRSTPNITKLSIGGGGEKVSSTPAGAGRPKPKLLGADSKEKFRSMGSLQMEPSLPAVPM